MKKLAIFLLVLGLLPGCKHDDKKNDPAAAGELVGRWMTTVCEADVGGYSKTEMKFEATSFSVTYHYYSDSNCITMTNMDTDSYTYKTGNSITATSGNKATEIDITWSAADGGATYLDIYAIIDNKLYFGEVVGTTRPTALDFSSYLVKI